MFHKILRFFFQKMHHKEKPDLSAAQSATGSGNAIHSQLDNIEFIDTTPHDANVVTSKGYHTLEVNQSSYSTSSDKKPSNLNSSMEDDVFTSPTVKTKPKSKGKGLTNKKRVKKNREVNREASSSSSSSGGSKHKKEITNTIRTVRTDVETKSYVTTTTSLNKYTFMKLPNEQEVKKRTQSCSSISYDDIIDNLAVFRKSFDNVNIFQDKELHKNIIAIKKSKEPPTNEEQGMSCEPENIRAFVNELLTKIFETAVFIVIDNDLKLERQTSNTVICKTGDVVPSYLPKMPQTPSTDNLIDARSFVENYEEFHDSCSEIPESRLVAGQILTEIIGNVDAEVSQRPKKRKDKFVKHVGVTRCIPVETDSNAEEETDILPQNDKRLLEVGPKYNVPKNFFKVLEEMTEITDQNIADNNPEMVEQPQLVVVPKEGKDFIVEDDDDVYKPIAVSPCGRFFKYEEEVSCHKVVFLRVVKRVVSILCHRLVVVPLKRSIEVWIRKRELL